MKYLNILFFIFIANNFNLLIADELKIGMILPLTGLKASQGGDAMEGVNLATAELPKGAVNVIVEDGQADPVKSVAAYQKLRQAGVNYVITQMSNVSLVISPLANADKVIQFGISTNTSRYSVPNDYTFRINGSTAEEAKAMADFFQKNVSNSPQTRTAVISTEDEYPISLYNDLKREFKDRNITIDYENMALSEEINFRSIILQLKQRKIDNIIFLGHQYPGGYFIKQMREVHFEPKLTIVNQTMKNKEFFTIAGEATEGIFMPSIGTSKTHPALTRYTAKYNKILNWYTANGYDSVMIAAQVLTECKGQTSDCVKAKLFNLKNYDGLSGVKSMDSKFGDMPDKYEILKVANKQLVSVN